MLAYAELLIQFPDIQEEIVSYMEFGVGNTNLSLNSDFIAMGGVVGLLVSSYLSYLIGYIGPFSFCGNHR